MTRCPACGTRSLGAHGTCPARAAESSAEPPTPHLNGFVPERALGTGAFATVFSARRVSDGRQVALKVAPLQPPEARVQLDAEAQVLAALGPPWSPELLGRAQLADGAPVLVLEQVPGRTLAALLAEEPPVLPLPRLVELARPVLDAVAALHARGWAHLDVKPENVLLHGSPLTARLLDYSLAQPRDAAQVNEAFTGTPDSMAPEQVRGLAADARADVYALGVLLFELACGRPPFLGTSAEVRQAHVSLRAPRPSTLAQLPAPLEALLLKCLTKEPESRFADASELRAAFDLAVTAEVRAATQSQGAEEGLVRRKAALVFMQSTAGLAALQSALAAAGGVLGHAAKGRAVGVFEADASHDPVGRALRTARGLIERGMIERARIDVGEITRQQRSGGPPRLISTAFLQDDRYPVRTDPAGPVLTPAAQEILPNRAQDTGNEVSERLRAGVTPITPLVELAQQVQPHPLVGRASVLDGLTESARNAVENRLPTASLVLGEVGIGKSHTCAALAERLRLRLPEVQIVELRLREPVAGLPDEALRLLLASALDLPAEATAAQARDRLTAALGEHAAAEAWPAVVVGLGLPEPEDERLLSLRAAPGALRALSVRALGEALRCRAAQRPLCVLIDDAHFADDAALDALEFASLAEARAPLWLCLWARPAFEQSRRRFGERAASRRVSQLSPLEAEAARELCKALLLPAENTPVEAIDRLVQRAQGMPLLLVELVRGLKRDGLVRRKSRGAGWFLATEGLDRLPELPLIEWLAERELSALATDLAAHARLTSLLGPEFTAAEVEGILAELDREQIAARFPLDVRVGNLRLTASGLLAAGTGAALRFRHALVRDAVARTVSAPLRKAIHRAATRFYRIGGSAHGPSRLALLAWHAARAEDEPGPLRTEAAGIYLELAERARVRHAYVEAETTFTRALELLPEGDLARRLVAHRGRGDTRFRIGRSEGSVDDFAEARRLSKSCGRTDAEIDILLDEATAWDWQNDHPRSQALVDEARALASRQQRLPLLVQARLSMGEGRALFRAGRWESACTSLEDAAEIAQNLGDPGYETLIACLTMLEVVLPMLGRIDDAQTVSERAVLLASERQDLLHLASALNNRRNLLIARRDVNAAVADQQRFMRIGRELGIVLSEYYGEYNLGELLSYAGRLDEADVHTQRAVELEATQPDVAARPVALLLRARLLAHRGQEAQALELAQKIRAQVAAGGTRAALAPSENVLLRAVELACVPSTPAQWAPLLAESERESIEQEPIEVLELMALSFARRGLAAEARAGFQKALAVAAKVPNILEPRVLKGLTALT